MKQWGTREATGSGAAQADREAAWPAALARSVETPRRVCNEVSVIVIVTLHRKQGESL